MSEGTKKREKSKAAVFFSFACGVLASSLAPLILGMVAQYFVVAASERHFCSKEKKKTSMNRRPRCVGLNVCQVVQSLSYSPTPVPLNQLSNQRERIWGKPPPLSVSLCPSQTHSLVFVSLFSLCLFKIQSLSSALLTLNSVLSLNDRSANGICDIFTCYMATQREMLS